MLKVNATLHTNGDGFWSSMAKAVRITELRVPANMMDDNHEWGELRVYFNTDDWDCEYDGDIYTDPLFQKELKEWLTANGFNPKGVGYSEYGMQGNKFVSLDVGKEFLESWMAKVTVEA